MCIVITLGLLLLWPPAYQACPAAAVKVSITGSRSRITILLINIIIIHRRIKMIWQ